MGSNSNLPSISVQQTIELETYPPQSAPSSSGTTMAGEEKQTKPVHEEEEARMNENILQLVRTYTAETQADNSTALFPGPMEGPLDPNSPSFNSRKWARAFYDIRTRVSEGAPPRTAGVAFRNVNAYGFGREKDFQKTVGNVFLKAANGIQGLLNRKQQRIDILHDVEGVLQAGEMLAVLGPPGSGCSTFLRTIAGDTHGFHLNSDCIINYQGINPDQMHSAFQGEAIYTAEVDHHFPHFTVGDTLYFAARARCPREIPEGVTREAYSKHLRDVTMAVFGILHTINTRVGDDFVRGVSGGERKRVTIAEAALTFAPIQCWDNSTRGLDSANALEFCRSLRTQADILGTTSCVAIYQASQDAYDVFDKVVVLYEGRQIFFGKTGEAREYFEGLGFVCPDRQTTADFLTSMTSHQERIIRPGFDGKAPRTPDEFAQAWKQSQSRSRLLQEIDDFVEQHPFDGEQYQMFLASRRLDQAKSQRSKSPFTLSYVEQVKLTLWRNWILLISDPSMTVTMLITNLFQSLIVGSIFYNLEMTSESMSKRVTLGFFIVLTNAFGSILEIMTLYAKRNIIDKHSRYALYHPSAEALSALIADLPYKIINCVITNIVVYFLTHMRRETGPFFFFLMILFIMTLTMSMMFRLMASVTKSIAQALAPSSVMLLVIALYTGFAIKVQNMQDWLGWLRFVNPVAYGFESLLLNEFVGLNYSCSAYIPSGSGYENLASDHRVCTVQGSVAGSSSVSGSAYLEASYGYVNSHRWRNVGIMIVFLSFFMALHLVSTEYIAGERSKGEVLVFIREAMKEKKRARDLESSQPAPVPTLQRDNTELTENVEKQKSVFHWNNICYDIKIKAEPRRILDNVDGWVKPGTLTALMGVSGAGKTTLLDVLASRITMGVITGDMLVNGHPRDQSFQRKTGYVTQQDLHLHTSTVREALEFSALLRQPEQYSHQEKIAYVDTVISLLGMEEYVDAIIGVPGEGLNVEQRKRLTIGVELAARPQLLLFLDEPTSGLDSQTSWSICNLMEKLTSSGQAILCTIHQPSALLFQRFNRLLLLARGGKTVYFGEIGEGSRTLIDYFVRNGGPLCPPDANPAEYMLEVIGAAPGAHSDVDWPSVWRQSSEYRVVQEELARLKGLTASSPVQDLPSAFSEFAAPLSTQIFQVTKRVTRQYWRSPMYIYSKAFLSCGAALFIGLSFLNMKNTQSGLQNQLFGVFTFLTVFSQLVDQILPIFVSQRTMYEARERPAKAYSWVAFIGANMFIEALWNSVMAFFSYVLWFYPMGLYRNFKHTDTLHSRSATIFLFIWVFFIFASSFAHLVVAALGSAEVAGGIVGLLSILMFSFCGVIAGPKALPGFWIFMYRVNPFTYFVEGFLGTALANAPATCSNGEFVKFSAPLSSTCGEYLSGFINETGGYLANPEATGDTPCQYCALDNTNKFLKAVNIDYEKRWRDFGIMWVFIFFNVATAIFFYWLARVPKRRDIKG